MENNPVRILVLQLGGARAVAEKLGMTTQAVQSWGRRAIIPPAYYKAIHRMANEVTEENGIEITVKDAWFAWAH